MLKKIENLRAKVASDGWTRAGVHRLIALVEEDGVESKKERESIAALLGRADTFRQQPGRPRQAERFLGRSRSELARFLDFIDRAQAPGPRSTLLGLGNPDLDADRYRENVEILAGERPTVHPRDGRAITFTDRFVPSPRHQLEELSEWLAERHRRLGLVVERQPVLFRERIYWNVIATIPGRSAEKVLLCDHYDVADKEHILPRSARQLRRDHHLDDAAIARRAGMIPVGGAVPGADDNASATAALLEMAELMRAALDRGVELERTVQLVHLVGEELPASCLGARTYLARARETEDRIAGVIVLDMIGVDRSGRRKVQLSPGRNPASLHIAAEVKRSIADLELDLRPVLRPFGSRKSFLHQTDAIHFSRAGIPVLLMNEHLNDDRDLYRVGYHDEFDVTALMTFPYAADVARAALEATFRLARPPSRRGAP